MQNNDTLGIMGKRVRCYHDGLGDDTGKGQHMWIDGTVEGVDGHLVRLGHVVNEAGQKGCDQVINTRHGEFIRFELVNT